LGDIKALLAGGGFSPTSISSSGCDVMGLVSFLKAWGGRMLESEGFWGAKGSCGERGEGAVRAWGGGILRGDGTWIGRRGMNPEGIF